MIVEYNKRPAVVIEKIDYMRMEVDIVATISKQTHSLQIVLLYEEINDSDVDRRLYGYKIGNDQFQKPVSEDDSVTIDWGDELSTDIYDWFDGTFEFSTEADVEELSETVDEVFSKVWDTLENEFLV